MLDNIIDSFVRATEPVVPMCQHLHQAIQQVGAAASGMFLGRHARAYIQDFRPKHPGEYYSNFEQRGPWVVYAAEAVEQAIRRIAQVPDPTPISEAAQAAGAAFGQSKGDLLPGFDALLASQEDEAIRKLHKEVADLPSHVSQDDFASAMFPRGSYITTFRDQRAGDIYPSLPPHLGVEAWLLGCQSFGQSARKLADLARHTVKYLQLRLQMKGDTVAKTDGKIFIGHGRSLAWRDLKEFLQDRLGLAWDEFNRESAAGLSTKERLEAMLDDACFALLVMTAEDEHHDGSKHARENVIHEAGLFQGRLGFERAIILLEEGCSEFGNVFGLTQIRFPKGNVMAKSEDIRRVLEREGILH
jgi:predicted nucleotide-binding protein